MTKIKKTPLLSALGKVCLERDIRHRYRKGLLQSNSPIYSAREMLETLIETLDELFQQEESPIRIGIETDHVTNIPSDRLGGKGIVKSLIIFDATSAKTRTTPLSVFPKLVRLDGKPFFFADPGGANRVLQVLLEHIASVIDAEEDVEA